jgi:hypothetical protein
MSAIDLFRRIAIQTPEAEPKITELPSGAVMMDLNIRGIPYCAEYSPRFKQYGLSKSAKSSPFWEGVDETFADESGIESRILTLVRFEN